MSGFTRGSFLKNGIEWERGSDRCGLIFAVALASSAAISFGFSICVSSELPYPVRKGVILLVQAFSTLVPFFPLKYSYVVRTCMLHDTSIVVATLLRNANSSSAINAVICVMIRYTSMHAHSNTVSQASVQRWLNGHKHSEMGVFDTSM